MVGGLAVGAAWEVLRNAMPQMTEVLRHRGPDGGDIWRDDAAGIALGHRRLSILDLSPAGHQPMVSACGRFVIAFNGEIYNHLDLRRQLGHPTLGPVSAPPREASAWRGHSDTETLLAGFARWGVRATIEKAIGMFAIALWDRETRTLTLVRDRIGEKPLYYATVDGTFLFASELKAIRAYPRFRAVIDRGALALLLRHNYIPAPYSIYEGVRKLPPGHLLEVSMTTRAAGIEQPRSPQPYWSIRSVIERGRNTFNGGDADAIASLDSLLRDAVRQQMIADVPLGAFLSGGIDSSTTVALMQAQSSRPVRTFTIGFHEAGYDEARHAKAVARHLGTDHTELYVTPRQALDVIPRLPTIYDEPFSDSSQIPTHLVSQMARRHVTVALSGDAGDELFGGYNRYVWALALWRRLQRFPGSVRAACARALTAVSPATWDRLFALGNPLLPTRLRYANAGDKVHKLAAMLTAREPEAIYARLVSHWDTPALVVIGATEPKTPINDPGAWIDRLSFAERMMFLDTITYLPDDILVKVDRAAMAVSLETRVPLLDHRVVEFAWCLPPSMKLRDGHGKWLLRQVLYKYVPRALVERPKMGFGVPIDAWLRGPLREWAESLLDPSRLRREGYFDPALIRQKWDEHLSERRNWQYHLWDILMFPSWHEHWMTR
ncbi:MAG: asparagine synthase (glutamine-hydrolyzing) [Burkholderiaceae bacterium]|nr:asparagine synthase (glutamine-hydrolyzing) [Burkholderiaceae bacterium]